MSKRNSENSSLTIRRIYDKIKIRGDIVKNNNAEIIAKTYQKKFSVWCSLAFLSAVFILFLPVNFVLSIFIAINVCFWILVL